MKRKTQKRLKEKICLNFGESVIFFRFLQEEAVLPFDAVFPEVRSTLT
jgi:hypothetical protein